MDKSEQEEASCVVQVVLDKTTIDMLDRLARQTSLPREALIPMALSMLEREGAEGLLQKSMPDHPLP